MPQSHVAVAKVGERQRMVGVVIELCLKLLCRLVKLQLAP